MKCGRNRLNVSTMNEFPFGTFMLCPSLNCICRKTNMITLSDVCNGTYVGWFTNCFMVYLACRLNHGAEFWLPTSMISCPLAPDVLNSYWKKIHWKETFKTAGACVHVLKLDVCCGECWDMSVASALILYPSSYCICAFYVYLIWFAFFTKRIDN